MANFRNEEHLNLKRSIFYIRDQNRSVDNFNKVRRIRYLKQWEDFNQVNLCL
ncbi:hypothetical protein EVA_15472 [gut metagenome]|uniref:Uncharacterized protein n=1 Tax=gut metagenome TaxID=749906 RepID=J9GAG4_9ZZZZ